MVALDGALARDRWVGVSGYPKKSAGHDSTPREPIAAALLFVEVVVVVSFLPQDLIQFIVQILRGRQRGAADPRSNGRR